MSVLGGPSRLPRIEPGLAGCLTPTVLLLQALEMILIVFFRSAAYFCVHKGLGKVAQRTVAPEHH